MTFEHATEKLIGRMRDDREHGASELARHCLDGLAEQARNIDADSAQALQHQLVKLARQLQNTRPTMAPIVNLVGRWITKIEKLPADNVDNLRSEAAAQAETLMQLSKDAVAKVVSNAAQLIGAGKTVITHSLSSTVVGVFEHLAPGVKAIVTESRPPGEGRRLAARLSELGIATDFISDQQMGLFVQRADIALVGADTIAVDGSVINKSGTYLLALAAREQGIPLYVCFESFKCSALAASDITLENHDPAELDPPELPHVKPHNIYFDVTPPNLVTAWITEQGVFRDAAALV